MPPLVRHFAERFAREYHKPFPDFSRGAWDLLIKAPWPGNVRELSGVVENFVFGLKGTGSLGARDVARELAGNDGFDHASPKSGGGLPLTRDSLVKTLDGAEWNRVLASEALGVSPRTLSRKMKELRLGLRSRKAATVAGNRHGS